MIVRKIFVLMNNLWHPLKSIYLRKKQKLNHIKLKAGISIKVLKSKGFDTFFGYYDLDPFSADLSKILAHRVSRRFLSKKYAEIGFYNKKNDFIKICKSSAWSWQLGSRLQWFDNNTIFINNVNKRNELCGQFIDLKQKTLVNQLNLPIFDISSDKKNAVTINFNDLFKYRPGYGYKNGLFKNDSGIWLLNIRNGASKKILDLDWLKNYNLKDQICYNHYINHLKFSPDGSKILFFHVWQNIHGKRKARAFIYQIKKGKCEIIENSNDVSHFCWFDNNKIIFFLKPFDSHYGYYLYNLKRKEIKHLENFIQEDGHPSRSGNKQFIIHDTFQNKYSSRKILLTSTKNLKPQVILDIYSNPFLFGKRKCDLHPRISNCGCYISIDSTHLGYRSQAILKLA